MDANQVPESASPLGMLEKYLGADRGDVSGLHGLYRLIFRRTQGPEINLGRFIVDEPYHH